MKGLLVKDLQLIRSNIRSYLASCAIMLIYIVVFPSRGAGFSTAYLTIMASIVVITTMSYDEFDHGMSFLMTLPVGRNTYVKEKYVFGFLAGATGWLVGFLANVAVAAVRGGLDEFWEMYLPQACVFLAIVVVSQALMIPVQIKAGDGSARMALIGTWVAAFLVIYFGVKVLDFLGLDLSVLTQQIAGLSPLLLIALIIAVLLLIFLVSMQVSQRFMAKKEF